MTSEEIIDYLDELRNTISFGYSDNVNLALTEGVNMLEEYKIMKNDILYYNLIKCNSCEHYNMIDEPVCHICGATLNQGNQFCMNNPS